MAPLRFQKMPVIELEIGTVAGNKGRKGKGGSYISIVNLLEGSGQI